MVAKIQSGKSLIGALNYNERKVEQGKACLLTTNGYLKNIDKMSFNDKLFRLTDLAQRNQRTRTNTVHLSLNFSVDDKLETEQLSAIAQEFMNRIGFADQPYLVYEHFDAGHPHIHIVTTNIQPDGKRISLNNIGKDRSEPARKAIEMEFGLVQAEKQHKEQVNKLPLKPVVYGAIESKRAITNIVHAIIAQYKFTSLPEFNALLAPYRVLADRGSQQSTMYRNGGLRYWIISADSEKVGVPVKASSIYQSPTLRNLEKKFKINAYLRKSLRTPVKRKIDQALLWARSVDQLRSVLQKDQVSLVIRQNDEGRIYGLSFIDYQHKVIFNGSDLGKNYSAGAITSALTRQVSGEQTAASHKNDTPRQAVADLLGHPNNDLSRSSLFEQLFDTGLPDQGGPGPFGPPKKRKKRKKLNQ